MKMSDTDEFVGDVDWDKVNMPSSDSFGDLVSAVVDHPSADDTTKPNESASVENPHAIQIVSIGSESDAYAFTFHEDSLNLILSKIQPSSMKVCVISVVGAFRTGKSFLLSWFLRYLHYHSQVSGDFTAKTLDSEPSTKWYEKFKSLGHDGFGWRGGAERNTTGIWMWSHPFILPLASNQTEKIAVLLVDTQGRYCYDFYWKMFSLDRIHCAPYLTCDTLTPCPTGMFDNETTMNLTASIFGLSTLLRCVGLCFTAYSAAKSS